MSPSNNRTLPKKVLSTKFAQLKNKMILESKSNTQNSVSSEKSDLSSFSERLRNDSNWLDFMMNFDNVYDGFTEKLAMSYPSLSKSDIRLTALLKLNLSHKEIDELMAVSDSSITKAKTRLRKKIGLNSAKELSNFINEFIAVKRDSQKL